MNDLLQLISPTQLKPSPTNPRKNLGDLAELVESLKRHGIIEPLVARKNGGSTLEIVCGHRRQAAAVKAELAEVPVIVRELTDDEVLDLQLEENLERSDLTPFEEAEAFDLRIKRGQTLQHVADRIGRAPSYVAQRLKLLALDKAVRTALDEEEITLGVALVIARLPDPTLQKEALSRVGGSKWDRCMPAAEAAKEIEEHLLLRLDTFDVTDAQLVPSAGACNECPKRTGSQVELFPDATSADLCLDPKCFRTKLDALFKLRVKEAKERGQDVLPSKELAKSTGYSGKFRRLDDTEYVGGKTQKIASLFKKTGLPPLTISQDPETGRVVELVGRADVDRVLRANRKEQAGKPGRKDGEDEFAARQRREAEKAKLRKKAVTRIAELAVEKGATVALEDILGLVVRTFAAQVWNETQRRVLKRRGIDTKGKHAEDEMLRLAQGLEPGGDLEGLGLELVVYATAPQVTHGGSDGTKKTWDDLCRVLGVDLKGIEKQLTAEKTAKEVSKSKPAKAKVGKAAPETRAGEVTKTPKSKRPKKSTPGVCRGCRCTDDYCCDGGCEWVEPDLCSSCAGE